MIVSFFGIRDAARSNPDLTSSHAQETLATLDPGEIIFEAPVDYVRRRLPELRAEHGPFDAVVAVMHMLMPNDLALAGRRASRVESEHERADAQRRRVGTRCRQRQDMEGGSERRQSTILGTWGSARALARPGILRRTNRENKKECNNQLEEEEVTGWNLLQCGRAGRHQKQKHEDICHIKVSRMIAI